MAEKFGDEQPLLDLADNFLKALRSRLQKEVTRTDTGVPARPREALPVVFRPSFLAV